MESQFCMSCQRLQWSGNTRNSNDDSQDRNILCLMMIYNFFLYNIQILIVQSTCSTFSFRPRCPCITSCDINQTGCAHPHSHPPKHMVAWHHSQLGDSCFASRFPAPDTCPNLCTGKRNAERLKADASCLPLSSSCQRFPQASAGRQRWAVSSKAAI